MYFSNHTSYLQRRCSSHAGGVCQRPSGASAYKPLIERCLFWYWGTPYFASAQYGLLFCHFAHLRRQRRHACGGNVPEYAPAPLGLASLYLHQTGKKARFAPYFALRAQYGLFIALFRYRSIRARGATAMCSGVPPLRAYACAAVLCARYAVRIRTAFSSKTSHARMHNRLSHNNHRPSDGALSRHLDARRRHSTVAYSRG